MDAIADYLLETNFDTISSLDGVEMIWSKLKDINVNAISHFAPKVRLRSHQFPKWFTPEIRHHIKCLLTLRRKCKLHPTPSNLVALPSSERALQSKTRSAKLQFDSDLIYDLAITGCPNIYKYLRKLTNQHQLPPTIYHDSKTASSDQDKACMFNEYLHSVFTNSSFELTFSHYFQHQQHF